MSCSEISAGERVASTGSIQTLGHLAESSLSMPFFLLMALRMSVVSRSCGFRISFPLLAGRDCIFGVFVALVTSFQMSSLAFSAGYSSVGVKMKAVHGCLSLCSARTFDRF